MYHSVGFDALGENHDPVDSALMVLAVLDDELYFEPESEKILRGDLILYVHDKPIHEFPDARAALEISDSHAAQSLKVERGALHPLLFAHGRYTLLAPDNARYIEVTAHTHLTTFLLFPSNFLLLIYCSRPRTHANDGLLPDLVHQVSAADAARIRVTRPLTYPEGGRPPRLYREDCGLFHNGRAAHPAVISAIGEVRSH